MDLTELKKSCYFRSVHMHYVLVWFILL